MSVIAANWHVAIPGVLIVLIAWALWKLCGCDFTRSRND